VPVNNVLIRRKNFALNLVLSMKQNSLFPPPTLPIQKATLVANIWNEIARPLQKSKKQLVKSTSLLRHSLLATPALLPVSNSQGFMANILKTSIRGSPLSKINSFSTRRRKSIFAIKPWEFDTSKRAGGEFYREMFVVG